MIFDQKSPHWAHCDLCIARPQLWCQFRSFSRLLQPFKPLASLWSTEQVARLKNDSKKKQRERRTCGAAASERVCVRSVYRSSLESLRYTEGDAKRALFSYQPLRKWFKGGPRDFPNAQLGSTQVFTGRAPNFYFTAH